MRYILFCSLLFALVGCTEHATSRTACDEEHLRTGRIHRFVHSSETLDQQAQQDRHDVDAYGVPLMGAEHDRADSVCGEWSVTEKKRFRFDCQDQNNFTVVDLKDNQVVGVGTRLGDIVKFAVIANHEGRSLPLNFLLLRNGAEEMVGTLRSPADPTLALTVRLTRPQ